MDEEKEDEERRTTKGRTTKGRVGRVHQSVVCNNMSNAVSNYRYLMST